MRLLFIYHCSLQIKRYSMTITTSSGGTKFYLLVQPQPWGLLPRGARACTTPHDGHTHDVLFGSASGTPTSRNVVRFMPIADACYGTSNGPLHTARNKAAFGRIYSRIRSYCRSSLVAGGARHILKGCILPLLTI